MVDVLLHKVDDSSIVSGFRVGEHVIGRRLNVSCNSKKVSRKHGVLNVTAEKQVYLSSTNNNPCFYQSIKDNSISLITFGKTVQLFDGDKIALSLDTGWLRVEIMQPTSNNTEIQNENITGTDNIIQSSSIKRALNSDIDTMVNKKQKLLETVNPSSSSNSNESTQEQSYEDVDFTKIKTEALVHIHDLGTQPHSNTTQFNKIAESADDSLKDNKNDSNDNNCPVNIKLKSTNDEVETKNVEVETTESDKTGAEDNSIKNAGGNANASADVDKNHDNSSKNENGANRIDVLKEAKETNAPKKKEDGADEKEGNSNKDNSDSNSDEPSTSRTRDRVWRDRCWFGNTCYRKNAYHRARFSHRHDSDYDSDPDDPRPICCYGSDCYRRNMDHRKRHRHPGQTQLGKPPTSRRKRQAQETKNATATNSDSEDSYDYSDPFLNDDSSDDYDPSEFSDTESEYLDEDIKEDNKRLLREARKFTRNF